MEPGVTIDPGPTSGRIVGAPENLDTVSAGLQQPPGYRPAGEGHNVRQLAHTALQLRVESRV